MFSAGTDHDMDLPMARSGDQQPDTGGLAARDLPPEPPLASSREEADLPENLLIEMLLRLLATHGTLRGADLSARLCLSFQVIEPSLAFLRAERLVEVTRRGSFDTDVSFQLTESGRARASDAFAKCRYSGPAPVSLEDYLEQVALQGIRDVRVDASRLDAALGDAVVSGALRLSLGAGLNSGRAIYLYGPSGTGKTFLAERMVGAVAAAIRMPYAIHVHGEIVQMFDPLVHHRIREATEPQGFDRKPGGDRRWALIRRPVVSIGGELSLDMLELRRDVRGGFYIAPPQLKANNGVLVIDDLGRQRLSVRELMNRWIVPLDRGVDYLALSNGAKFEIPFDVRVIFSSNLPPESVGDPAFLRRLSYKIHVPPVDEAGYREIFSQACARARLVPDDDSADFLVEGLHRANRLPFYAAVPFDLIGKLVDRASFLGEQPRVDPESLAWAWDLHFAPDADSSGVPTIDDFEVIR